MKFYVPMPWKDELFGRRWAYGLPVEPTFHGPAETCPICGGYISSLEWLPPRRLHLSSADPAKWGDFVWGAGIGLVVSERFVKAYQQAGLVGIHEFGPVEVARVGKKRMGEVPDGVPNYYAVFKIERLGPAIDVKASNVRYKNGQPECSFCLFGGRQSIERLIIDLSTWQGEDVFVPRGGTGMVVSERVHEIVEALRLTNVWLIPAENYGWDEERPKFWYVNGGPELSVYKEVFWRYCKAFYGKGWYGRWQFRRMWRKWYGENP